MGETRSTKLDGDSGASGIPVTGFVLAGGQSRRMGQDKATLEWRSRPLLDHMIQLLSTAADPVRIVGRDALPDRIPGLGPAGGILTALHVTETSKNLIVAVDLPSLTTGFLRTFRVWWTGSTKHILACKIGSDYPLCLGIDRAMLPAIEERIKAGRLAIRTLIEESDSEILNEETVLQAGFPISIFANVNTPEQWAKLV